MSYNVSEIYAGYVTVAENKTKAVWYKTVILSLLAGAFIAFGAAAATAAAATLEGSAAALAKAAVFPAGLALVVLFGAELFTGNNLLIVPALDKKISPLSLLRNWGIVYLGNLAGGVIIAVTVVFCGVQTGAVSQACIAVAANKCNMNFGIALLRAIPCNILVCLAVWFATGAKSAGGKLACLYMPIFTFVICGFEHCVANAYYLTAGLLSGSAEGLNAGRAIVNCLIPTTLGNIIGGAVISLALFALNRTPKKTDAAQ